jgi:hypothetical protein
MLAILREAILPLDPAESRAAEARSREEDAVGDVNMKTDSDDSILRVPNEYFGCERFGTYVQELHLASKKMLGYWKEMRQIEPSEPAVDGLRIKMSKAKEAALTEIAAGNEVAKLRVGELLSGTDRAVVGGRELTDDEKRIGEALLEEGREKGEDEIRMAETVGSAGWGQVAAEVMKIVKRLDALAHGPVGNVEDS